MSVSVFLCCVLTDDAYYYDDNAYDMLEEAADNLQRAREEFSIAKRMLGGDSSYKVRSSRTRSSRMLRH